MSTETLQSTLTKEQRILIFESVKKIADAAKTLLEISCDAQNEKLYNVTESIIVDNQRLLKIAS